MATVAKREYKRAAVKPAPARTQRPAPEREPEPEREQERTEGRPAGYKTYGTASGVRAPEERGGYAPRSESRGNNRGGYNSGQGGGGYSRGGTRGGSQDSDFVHITGLFGPTKAGSYTVFLKGEMLDKFATMKEGDLLGVSPSKKGQGYTLWFNSKVR
jgi:hypothetical protein